MIHLLILFSSLLAIWGLLLAILLPIVTRTELLVSVPLSAFGFGIGVLASVIIYSVVATHWRLDR